MTQAPHAPHADRCPIAAAALSVLDQCERLIAALPDPAYTAPSRVLPGGTVGKHVRHTVDHFQSLMSGFEQRRVVDYDHRQRGTSMESVQADAVAAIRDLRDRLNALSPPDMTQPVRVRLMLSARGTEAELLSTLGRELAFASHHAVHHHAMIRAIAAEHGHSAPDEFGKAPSTLAYEAAH